MATATIVIEEPNGYAGRHARCFRLSEPFRGFDYVVVWIQPSHGTLVGPKAVIVPSTETGAPAERSLKEQPGSVTLHDEPFTPGTLDPIEDKLEGAYWWALLQLGYEYIPAYLAAS